MTVSFHKYGDMFFPGTGDIKVIFYRPSFYFDKDVDVFYIHCAQIVFNLIIFINPLCCQINIIGLYLSFMCKVKAQHHLAPCFNMNPVSIWICIL